MWDKVSEPMGDGGECERVCACVCLWVGGGGRVFLILSCTLCACLGNGCYFLRDQPLRGSFFLSAEEGERKYDNSTIRRKEIQQEHPAEVPLAGFQRGGSLGRFHFVWQSALGHAIRQDNAQLNGHVTVAEALT